MMRNYSANYSKNYFIIFFLIGIIPLLNTCGSKHPDDTTSSSQSSTIGGTIPGNQNNPPNNSGGTPGNAPNGSDNTTGSNNTGTSDGGNTVTGSNSDTTRDGETGTGSIGFGGQDSTSTTGGNTTTGGTTTTTPPPDTPISNTNDSTVNNTGTGATSGSTIGGTTTISIPKPIEIIDIDIKEDFLNTQITHHHHLNGLDFIENTYRSALTSDTLFFDSVSSMIEMNMTFSEDPGLVSDITLRSVSATEELCHPQNEIIKLLTYSQNGKNISLTFPTSALIASIAYKLTISGSGLKYYNNQRIEKNGPIQLPLIINGAPLSVKECFVNNNKISCNGVSAHLEDYFSGDGRMYYVSKYQDSSLLYNSNAMRITGPNYTIYETRDTNIFSSNSKHGILLMLDENTFRDSTYYVPPQSCNFMSFTKP